MPAVCSVLVVGGGLAGCAAAILLAEAGVAVDLVEIKADVGALGSGIELETRPTGMGIWRVAGSRPECVTRTDLFYGGTCYIAGYCPTGDSSLYVYLVENAVLAELLLTRSQVSDKLWAEFTDRRYARAAEIVEASLQLRQWMLDHEQGDVPWLMHRISTLVSEPA